MESDSPLWPPRSLDEICLRVTSGGTPARRERERYYSADGYAWVKTKELIDGPISDTEERITKLAIQETAAKLLPRGTLLMAMYASPTVGRLGLLTTEAACNQACAALVVDEQEADHRFVFYALRQHRWRLQQIASGSAQQNINGRIVKAFEMPFPPRPEQSRIADVLGTLDARSESNRRFADLLEQIAQTEFGARFTDFVDVHNLAHTELGQLPEGWKAGRLEDVVDVTMGQSPPGSTYSDDPQSGLPLVQGMGSFGQRFPKSAIYTSAPGRRALPGTTVMTVRAPVGAVNVAQTEVCLGRGVAGLYSPHKAFAEFLVKSLRGRWRSEEAGTIFPAVNQKQVRRLPVAVPPHARIEEFEAFAKPIVDRIGVLHDETETLAAIRDALLPKLVSGQIRVPDTADPEEVVGPVAEEVAA